MSQRRVVAGLYAINAALVAIGLLSMLYHGRALGIFLVAFVAAAYIVVRHLARVELWESGTAILKGLHRPVPKVAVVILYPLADVLLMSLALVAAIALISGAGSYPALRDEYVRLAPVWVGTPFLFMIFSRTYARVWSRARMAEFVILNFAVLGGILTALAISILAGRAGPGRSWNARLRTAPW